jgi:hypothetical protein
MKRVADAAESGGRMYIAFPYKEVLFPYSAPYSSENPCNSNFRTVVKASNQARGLARAELHSVYMVMPPRETKTNQAHGRGRFGGRCEIAFYCRQTYIAKS